MPSAFVTGGSGFVGRALIRRLVGEGWDIRALARSGAAARTVSEAGAEAVNGDLSDAAVLRQGAEGAEYTFHAAAKVDDWGPAEEYERDTVQGTQRVLASSRDAGVRRFVHVGTEAALMAGQPLVQVDETAPLRPDSPAPYPWSKAKAEQAVRDADGDGFETVVIRPRFVWGRGDTVLLPRMKQMVQAGQFAWIGGGRQLTATAHIDNVAEGLFLGATRGRPGGVYFITDGDPVVFRDFVSDLLRTQGVEPPARSVPTPIATAVALAGETLSKTLGWPKAPPLTRFTVWVSSQECTIDISRARGELGYEPIKSRLAGLEELRADHAGAAAS